MSIQLPSHRNVASIRPPPLSSPHTPTRNISASFGSPSTLRAEEDVLIIELGARYLRAGFACDSSPKAVVDFGPETQRRPGDYRRWDLGYDKLWRDRLSGKRWGEAYELWRPDLRELNLGLVGDRVERAMREVFTQYLLVDSRPRRMVLVIPSALPLPLLSTVLDTMFTNFQCPNISLMSAPVLTTVAAGLRSGLVVDIGWAETVVTAVYEYREVGCQRSVRAMKMLGEATYLMLAKIIAPQSLFEGPEDEKIDIGRHERISRVLSFEECEDVTVRMAWCKSGKSEITVTGLASVQEEDEMGASMRLMNIGQEEDPMVTIPLASAQPPTKIRILLSELAKPCEDTLLAPSTLDIELDDEEIPLPLLIYRNLLHLPVDVRTMCMSRIMFVGGGSRIPGLKQRVLAEVGLLVQQRGWDPVTGKAIQAFKSFKQERTLSRQAGPPSASTASLPAFLQDHDTNEIDPMLDREKRKIIPPAESGYFRAVESMGAWSGASLLSQLKISAASVVDKDQWLQHGAAGATKSGEVNTTSNRQSMGPGVLKAGVNWTLGVWA